MQIRQTGETELGVTTEFAFNQIKEAINNINSIEQNMSTTLKELENIFGRTLSFAVEIAYVNDKTLDYIIGKAGSHEKALEALVGSDEEAVKKEEKKVEAPKICTRKAVFSLAPLF